MTSAMWESIPEEVLLSALALVEARDVSAAAQTCQRWRRVASTPLLWKRLLCRDFGVSRSIRPPVGTDWVLEYKRLAADVPLVQAQCLEAHSHQVLHVAFSHDGTLFSSASKDGTVAVWTSRYPCTLRYQHDLKRLHWKHTLFTQFNRSDTLLLVSGVHFGSDHSTSGEIAVFALQDELLLQCRVVNKPYDVFGCWIGENHLLSGELHWLGHLTSATVLWINKASQEPESEHTPIISHLYRFHNPNASTVRSLLVAECKWNGSINKDDVIFLDDEDHFRLFSNSMSIVYEPEYLAQQQNVTNDSEEESSETDSGSWSSTSRDEELRNKLLIFTIGADTYTPHRIGFKRIEKVEFPEKLPPGPSIKERIAARKEELARERERERQGIDQPNWADFESVKDMFDIPDKVIDLKGHIIGMAVSPDNKYLYVNSRPWPPNYVINNPLSPPPYATQIDIHVIDLVTLNIVGKMLRSHQEYTMNSGCFFTFLDVSDKYVASGADNSAAYIWDRHFGICLTRLPHSDCVNAIALNPADPRMCVTACDDYSVKVWHSRSYIKELRIGGRGQVEGVALHSRSNIV